MTLQATSRRAPVATGNGVATQFPFDFKVFLKEEVFVTKTNTDGSTVDWTLNSQYMVTLNVDQEADPGGLITTTGTPLTSSEKIVVYGKVDYDQPLDLPTGGKYSAQALENQLDRVGMQVQQLADGLNGALRVPISEAIAEIPAAAARALRVLAFDADGDPVVIPGVDASSAAALALDLLNSTAAAKGASLVGYDATLAYASGTVGARLRRQLSVKDKPFNAVGDGVANDTAAITAALTALAALGGGDLLLPPGTYLCSPFTVSQSNVRIFSQRRTGTLKFDDDATTNFITLTGSNVEFNSVVIDTDDAPGIDGIGAVGVVVNSPSVATNNVSFVDCHFKGMLVRPGLDFRMSIASRGVVVEKCEFTGSPVLTPRTAPSSQTSQGIRFLVATGCGNWRIKDNISNYCGLVLQIRHSTTQAFDQFDLVVVDGNQFNNALDDPNISTSPMEIFCVTGLVVVRNTLRTGGRGFNGTFVKNAVYASNVAYDQTFYFLELQNSDGVAIVGNQAYNCKTFVNDTVSTSPVSKNITIAGNLTVGGSDGEVSFNFQVFATLITMQAAGSGYENWTIKDNVFINPKYTDSVVRIDGTATKNMVIEGNVFVIDDVTSRPRAVLVARGSNVLVRGNRVIRAANVTDVTLATNSTYAFFSVTTGTGDSRVRVLDNEVFWTGTDVRTTPNNTGVIGIGSFASAAALTLVEVSHNKLVGNFSGSGGPLYLQINSGDTQVVDNDLTEATGTSTLNAAIVYRRTKRRFESAAAPAAGTWAVGDHCRNSAPAVGQPKGWFCTVAGTPGTWVSEGNL